MLLSAQIPFYAKRSKNIIAKIKRARYTMSGSVWDNISNGAKHLVANLLVVDTSKRYTSQQVLEHLWIRKWAHRNDTAPTDEMLESVDNSLQQYKNTSTLKKLALNVSV
jgi:calcium-dependent protein kinase